MTIKINAPKIFVTYYTTTEFRICGEWLEVNEELELQLNKQLANLGKGSFYCVTDYDNFHGAEDWLGEYASVELIQQAADLIKQEGQLGACWINFLDGNVEKAIETFQDAYAGCYQDLEDFAREINQDKEIPDWLEYYVNWNQMAEDLIFNGEIKVVEIGLTEVHVFWNRR
jgi:antirestriction protein